MTAISRHLSPASEAKARSAAEPLTFSGTVGLFTPASEANAARDIAVLFASPWGLEEMCTRKFWRIIAEKLADKGIASLRFDYPGTGDALDDMDFTAGLSVWSDSLVAAGEKLKALSGCRRIVMVSQGLGAVVATRAAEQIEGLEAMAYMAPVTSGRLHLREIAVWSKVVDENLGLTEEQRNTSGVSVASLVMPLEIAEEIKKLDLVKLDRVPAIRALVIGRANRPTDREFAARLATLGVEVTEQEFKGYDQLVSDPAISKLPLPIADQLAGWVASLPSQALPAVSRLPLAVEPLSGGDFAETPVRLGTNARLSGILCEPLHGRSGATVLFLTSSYDRHAGWGRSTVSMARALARCGIASLRFDTANTGDSPPVPGRPEQVLYHASQNTDVIEALDFLDARKLAPVVTAGRCSGAYLGFQTALIEPRIAGEVLVNPIVFRWQPGRSVEDAIVKGTRTLTEYGQRAFKAKTLKRVLRGEVDLAAVARNIIKGVGKRIKARLLYAFRGALPEGRAIYGAFRTLNERDLPVSLIYSENDLGLQQYGFYFGRDGSGLAQFPNVSPAIIPDSDHNLTPDHAREIYFTELREMAFRFPPSGVAGSSEPRDSIAAE